MYWLSWSKAKEHIYTEKQIAELSESAKNMHSNTDVLKVALENISATESRMLNTEEANELVNLVQQNIKDQAGLSTKVQSNITAQNVLELLS